MLTAYTMCIKDATFNFFSVFNNQMCVNQLIINNQIFTQHSGSTTDISCCMLQSAHLGRTQLASHCPLYAGCRLVTGTLFHFTTARDRDKWRNAN